MPQAPRIVVDARMAGAQGHGIGLYVRQMAEGLARLASPAYELLYLIAPECPRDSPLRGLPNAVCTIPFLHPSEPFRMPGVVRKLEPALFHAPSFASLWRYPCPHLQTVHDLNHLQYGGRAHRFYYRFVLLPSLFRARAVLSVSESAALELRCWLADNGCARDVTVAPNAVGTFPDAGDAEELRRLGLAKDGFFLALSNAKPHKNLALLERAYLAARARRALPPLVLTVPGASATGIVRTGPLGDSTVGALLRNARACFFPSLYEGFGRPPVEAALEGTLPVASAIAPHKEALAGVTETVFLDPREENAWTEAFLRFAETAPRVSQRSRGWITETWSQERLARVMDGVYRSCLE